MDKKSNVVTVFSDGISSFVDKFNKPVPTIEIYKYLTDFKSFGECFIKRRAKKCFTKIFPDLGWVNNDDVSMIGYHHAD